MKEYKIITSETDDQAQDTVNDLAKEEWNVISHSIAILLPYPLVVISSFVLEKEVKEQNEALS